MNAHAPKGEQTMAKKFQNMIYEFTPEDTSFGPWSHSPQPFLHGEEAIPGANLTAGFQVITAPVTLEDEPICHREEETMFFLGAQLPDVFSSFDAEIHFYMGPALDKMEKIVITEPSAVRVPKDYWHGPLKFVRVDKPILFQAAQFSGRPGYLKKVKTADGEMVEFIEGEAHRKPHVGERPSVAWTVVNEDGVELYTEAGAYDASKAPYWEELREGAWLHTHLLLRGHHAQVPEAGAVPRHRQERSGHAQGDHRLGQLDAQPENISARSNLHGGCSVSYWLADFHRR
jgi:hypothetical protein